MDNSNCWDSTVVNLMQVNSIGTTINGDLSVGSNVKLYKDGRIWAKTEIRVNTTNAWGDFVFNSNYKLKPLKEVEAFINDNKHLEGIPSASEVETNGINLGEMTTILTQKVEELTLYIIELQKDNENIKKEMELLKKNK